MPPKTEMNSSSAPAPSGAGVQPAKSSSRAWAATTSSSLKAPAPSLAQSGSGHTRSMRAASRSIGADSFAAAFPAAPIDSYSSRRPPARLRCRCSRSRSVAWRTPRSAASHRSSSCARTISSPSRRSSKPTGISRGGGSLSTTARPPNFSAKAIVALRLVGGSGEGASESCEPTESRGDSHGSSCTQRRSIASWAICLARSGDERRCRSAARTSMKLSSSATSMDSSKALTPCATTASSSPSISGCCKAPSRRVGRTPSHHPCVWPVVLTPPSHGASVPMAAPCWLGEAFPTNGDGGGGGRSQRADVWRRTAAACPLEAGVPLDIATGAAATSAEGNADSARPATAAAASPV
eukprot:scaffold3696_cov27-Tisochrysis_lutea.AAC.5